MVGWEIELGSAQGELVHRKIFGRKVDPVVNGICNMDSFTPITEIKTEKPTVTMLSHVQYLSPIYYLTCFRVLIIDSPRTSKPRFWQPI